MLSVLCYLGSIILANFLVMWYGIIDLGFIMFPAGALVVGLTFSARDFVQRRFGKYKAWIWMGIASGLSAFFSKDVAFASVVAFLASEFTDWAVYTYIGGSFRKRIILSNLFGTPLDSLIFVPMVFGWVWPAIIGQAIVKLIGSLLVFTIPFIWNNKDVRDGVIGMKLTTAK